MADPIRDSNTAVQLFRPCVEGLDREHFLVCGLDAKHRVIGINVVSVGTLTLSIVHPREVFKPLIVMNAAAWLCAHNHPSGDSAPSQEDRLLTKRLRQGPDDASPEPSVSLAFSPPYRLRHAPGQARGVP